MSMQQVKHPTTSSRKNLLVMKYVPSWIEKSVAKLTMREAAQGTDEFFLGASPYHHLRIDVNVAH